MALLQSMTFWACIAIRSIVLALPISGLAFSIREEEEKTLVWAGSGMGKSELPVLPSLFRKR